MERYLGQGDIYGEISGISLASISLLVSPSL